MIFPGNILLFIVIIYRDEWLGIHTFAVWREVAVEVTRIHVTDIA